MHHKTASDNTKHKTAIPRTANNSRSQINDINNTLKNIRNNICLYSPKSAKLKCNTFNKNQQPPIPSVKNALFLLKTKKSYTSDSLFFEKTTSAINNKITPTAATTNNAHITFKLSTLAARPGFEPRQTGPKPVVLPLHHRAIHNN